MALQTHSLSTLIDKLAQSPAKPGDRIGTIQHLVETANTLFAADVSVMFAINPSTVRLLTPAGVAGDLHASDPANLELPRLDGITGQVLEQGILTIPDLAQHPEFQSTFKQREGIHSVAAVALYTRQHRPLAILFLNFRRARQFAPEDLDLLQLFATQASLVLQHTRALRRYHEVARIGHEINQELDTAKVLFQNLLAHIGDILDITHGFMLAVYVPQTHSLNLFLTEDGQYQAVPDQAIADLRGCEWVIENQQPLVIHHYREEVADLPVQLLDVAGTESKVFETLIFLPLTSRGVPLGVLSLQHMRPHAYDDEDLRILELLGNHVASALNNIRLYSNARWLNKTGQILTQQLDSERVLQDTVDHIRTATKADLVILHSYIAASQLFDPLPRVSGELHAPSPLRPSAPRPDDIAWLVVQRNQPVFAKDSGKLFETLNGDPQTRKGSFEQREQIHSTAAVPLCVGEEAVGVLFVNFRRPQRFDAPQKLLIDGLASYAAIAIKNSREFDTLTQRRVRELEVLQKIDREISRTLDLQKVMQAILELAGEHISAEESAMVLYNPRNNMLECKAAIGRNAHYRLTWAVPADADTTITCWVFEHKRTARVGNVRTDPLWRDIYFEVDSNIRSEIDVPLMDGQEILGVINFESTQEHAFSHEDQGFAETLAGQAVLAIKNAQAYEREHRLAREKQTMIEIDTELSKTLDLQQVMQKILDLAAEHIPCDAASILLYNPRAQTLQMQAAIGTHIEFNLILELSVHQDRGFTPWVFRNKKPLRVADVHSDPIWREMYIELSQHTRSEMDVPLLDDNEVTGIINFESRSAAAFSQDDEDFLVALAQQAVLAIRNAQAYDREQRLAREKQTMIEINNEISKTLDLQQVMQKILDLAAEHIPCDAASILLYNPRAQTLQMQAAIGTHIEVNQIFELPVYQGKGITSWAFEHKTSVRIDNVDSDPKWRDLYAEASRNILSEMDVPLLDDNEVTGIINFESRSAAAFSQDDEDFLVALAQQAVLAIRNAQAYDREQRIAQEQQALFEIGQEITSQLDTTKIFELILDKALGLTDSSTGTLMMYDPLRNDLWMAAERGVIEEQKNSRHSVHKGIVGWVAQHKQLQNIEDVTQPPWNTMYLPFIKDVRSQLTVPLLENNQLRGVINIESATLGHFNDRDERLLTALADLAVIATQNAESYQRAQQGKTQLRALHEIDQSIISQLDKYDQVIHTILENALRLINVEIADLDLYENGATSSTYFARYNKGQLFFEHIDATHPELFQLPRGIIARVAETRQSYRTRHDAQEDPYYAGSTETHSEVAVPLLAGSELVGVLNLESQQHYAFAEEDVEVLELFAGQAVIAIQNATSYAQSERNLLRFRLLHQAGQQLGGISDLIEIDHAYDIIIQTILEHSQSQIIIRRYDATTQELVLARCANIQGAQPVAHKSADTGLNWQVLRERRTIVVPDVQHPPADVYGQTTDTWTRSRIIIPIQFEGGYYGNLGLSHGQANYFRDTDVQLFEGLAYQLAITIHRLEATQAHQEAEKRLGEAKVMSSIGQSAMGLAHRLGNDLGLVKTTVNNIRLELAAQGMDNAAIHQDLDQIVQDVRRVLDLSTRLKAELSDFHADQSPRESVVLPFNVLMQEIEPMFPTIPANIEVRREEDVHTASVRVVPSDFADIVYNLIKNALDAMPDGGVLALQVRRMGRYVELQVSDTGVGIPPAKQPQIFNLFYSTKGSFGFGLWSARRNALANGGDITVESVVGQGTTFTLVLPLIDDG